MKKSLPAVLLVVIAVALAVYYGARVQATRNALSRSGPAARALSPAPSLTMVDLDGNKITSASYAGKVVLVNFWAAWCTPCAEEVPQLMALQERYRHEGLQLIGVSMEDRDSELRAFYRKYQMNYPVVAGSQQIAEAYGGILGLPTTFLIGRDGRIHAKYPGMVDFPKVEQEITALLRSGE